MLEIIEKVKRELERSGPAKRAVFYAGAALWAVLFVCGGASLSGAVRERAAKQAAFEQAAAEREDDAKETKAPPAIGGEAVAVTFQDGEDDPALRSLLEGYFGARRGALASFSGGDLSPFFEEGSEGLTKENALVAAEAADRKKAGGDAAAIEGSAVYCTVTDIRPAGENVEVDVTACGIYAFAGSRNTASAEAPVDHTLTVSGGESPKIVSDEYGSMVSEAVEAQAGASGWTEAARAWSDRAGDRADAAAAAVPDGLRREGALAYSREAASASGEIGATLDRGDGRRRAALALIAGGLPGSLAEAAAAGDVPEGLLASAAQGVSNLSEGDLVFAGPDLEREKVFVVTGKADGDVLVSGCGWLDFPLSAMGATSKRGLHVEGWAPSEEGQAPDGQ